MTKRDEESKKDVRDVDDKDPFRYPLDCEGHEQEPKLELTEEEFALQVIRMHNLND